MFLKLGIVAWLASQLGALTGISGAIWALVLGVVFTTLGFPGNQSADQSELASRSLCSR